MPNADIAQPAASAASDPFSGVTIRVGDMRAPEKSFAESLGEVERLTGVVLSASQPARTPQPPDVSNREEHCIAVAKSLGKSGMDCPLAGKELSVDRPAIHEAALPLVVAAVTILLVAWFSAMVWKVWLADHSRRIARAVGSVGLTILWVGSVVSWHLVTGDSWPSPIGTVALLAWPPIAALLALLLWLHAFRKQ